MPATDLYQLYAFEDQFMRAAALILEAAGFPTPYARGDQRPLPDTVTLVRFTTGAATGEMLRIGAGPAAGRPTYGRYTGVLEVVRYRPRAENAALADIAGIQRELGRDAGRIRPLFLREAIPFTAERLPFLLVTDVLPQPSSWGFDEEHQLDMFTLSWLVSFEIRANAWPPAKIRVTGAGSAEANGDWYQAEIYNDRPRFFKVGFVDQDGGQIYLDGTPGGPQEWRFTGPSGFLYFHTGAEPSPVGLVWQVADDGLAPAPTITAL